MAAETKVTILGCGSSGGVPRIGNDWGDCDRQEPRNSRRRCSILVEKSDGNGTTRVLVDTGPDMRQQMLDAGVLEIDAALYTHHHADHLHGIDDLRVFAIMTRRKVAVHMDEATSARAHEAFDYCFTTPPGSSYPPILDENRIVAGTPTVIDGAGGPISFLPVPVHHGDISSLGFVFDGIGYLPDVSEIPEESVTAFSGLETFIVDALRRTPHPSHFSLDDALTWIRDLAPGKAVLTNMHIDMDYRTLCNELPSGVEPAFDGMVLSTSAK